MFQSSNWLTICGIGAAVFHLLIPLVLGFLDRGYNPMRQYISELAAPKRPFAAMVNLSFAVAGALTLGFAWGLHGVLPRSAVAWMASVLLFLDGISNITAGLFPVDSGSLIGKVHTVVSQIGSTVGVSIPLFVWLAIRLEVRWQPLASFTLVMQLVIVLVFLLFAYVTETRKRPSSRAVIGLFQKLYLGFYYLWFVVVAMALAR